MFKELAVDITVLSDRNATVAQAEMLSLCDAQVMPEAVATATGSSKREPGDIYNEDIAVKLAVARALTKLSRQLTSEARDMVAKAEAEAEERRARLAERQMAEALAADPFANLASYLRQWLGLPDTMPIEIIDLDAL